jgi:hypothetical protein
MPFADFLPLRGLLDFFLAGPLHQLRRLEFLALWLRHGVAAWCASYSRGDDLFGKRFLPLMFGPQAFGIGLGPDYFRFDDRYFLGPGPGQ